MNVTNIQLHLNHKLSRHRATASRCFIINILINLPIFKDEPSLEDVISSFLYEHNISHPALLFHHTNHEVSVCGTNQVIVLVQEVTQLLSWVLLLLLLWQPANTIRSCSNSDLMTNSTSLML